MHMMRMVQSAMRKICAALILPFIDRAMHKRKSGFDFEVTTTQPTSHSLGYIFYIYAFFAQCQTFPVIVNFMSIMPLLNHMEINMRRPSFVI